MQKIEKHRWVIRTLGNIKKEEVKSIIDLDQDLFWFSPSDVTYIDDKPVLDSEDLRNRALQVADVIINYATSSTTRDLWVDCNGDVIRDDTQGGYAFEFGSVRKEWPYISIDGLQRMTSGYLHFSDSLKDNYQNNDGFTQTIQARELLGLYVLNKVAALRASVTGNKLQRQMNVLLYTQLTDKVDALISNNKGLVEFGKSLLSD